MQAGNITPHIKVKIYFNLPQFSVTKIVTWNFIWMTPISLYGATLGIDLLIESLLNPKFSEHVIKSDYGPLKYSSELIVYFGKYSFKDLNTEVNTPK